MSLRIGEWVSKNVPKPQQNIAALALGAVMGVPFGFLLEKGKVFLPYYIREQMLMRDFTMMSFFLSATAGVCAPCYIFHHATLTCRRVSFHWHSQSD
jgi:hypothetical protein